MEHPMNLSIELVLNVLYCYSPAPNTILSPSDLRTKTILSFTLVCRETRKTANRLLQKYCVHLSSSKRLRSFLAEGATRPELMELSSLYLAPFAEDIHDLLRCQRVRQLLCTASKTLTKLVISMPLRSVWPEDDHYGSRPVLREAFESLVNLVEFVTIHDELYLDVRTHEHVTVWRQWPKLKRLAVYNPDLNENFWRNIAEHASLETLCVSNVDGLEDFNPKQVYFRQTDRPLKVILCLSHYWYGGNRGFDIIEWERYDPDNKMMMIEKYIAKTEYEDMMPFRHPGQEFVQAAAKDGSLWTVEGPIIIAPGQLIRGT